MVQVFINSLGKTDLIELDIGSFDNLQQTSVEDAVKSQIITFFTSRNIQQDFKSYLVDGNFYLTTQGGQPLESCNEYGTVNINFNICGGIDFQHREGSKVGMF